MQLIKSSEFSKNQVQEPTAVPAFSTASNVTYAPMSKDDLSHFEFLFGIICSPLYNELSSPEVDREVCLMTLCASEQGHLKLLANKKQPFSVLFYH